MHSSGRTTSSAPAAAAASIASSDRRRLPSRSPSSGASWAHAMRTVGTGKACHALPARGTPPADSAPRTRRRGGAMAELELEEVTLFYEQSGSGGDVVWLAAGDHPGHNWRRYQTPAFDDRYRSTTYDARGVGGTRPASPPPWPISTHAQDAISLIEAVCVPPVALVGLSLGSLIAVQLAHDRPDLVRCAVVTGTCVKKTGFIREWE